MTLGQSSFVCCFSSGSCSITVVCPPSCDYTTIQRVISTALEKVFNMRSIEWTDSPRGDKQWYYKKVNLTAIIFKNPAIVQSVSRLKNQVENMPDISVPEQTIWCAQLIAKLMGMSIPSTASQAA